MKPSSKAVMIGCISFFVFLYGNLLFGGLVGSLIPSGDDFINSYFYPLYTAVTLLISLIIFCAFGLAAAAPRSPYRHLELCGIALIFTHFIQQSHC